MECVNELLENAQVVECRGLAVSPEAGSSALPLRGDMRLCDRYDGFSHSKRSLYGHRR